MLTEIFRTHRYRIQHQLETLFMTVTSSVINIGDRETTTRLFRCVCGYNDYQEQLVKILNHEMLSFQNRKDDMLKASGRAALLALLSPEKKEFMRVLKASIAMEMNLDIRNSSGNSPLPFARDNGEIKAAQ